MHTENYARLLDRNQSITRSLDLVSVEDEAKFHKLAEEYLAIGYVTDEEIRFVNYMSQFFAYRLCSIAKLRAYDYVADNLDDESIPGSLYEIILSLRPPIHMVYRFSISLDASESDDDSLSDYEWWKEPVSALTLNRIRRRTGAKVSCTNTKIDSFN